MNVLAAGHILRHFKGCGCHKPRCSSAQVLHCSSGAFIGFSAKMPHFMTHTRTVDGEWDCTPPDLCIFKMLLNKPGIQQRPKNLGNVVDPPPPPSHPDVWHQRLVVANYWSPRTLGRKTHTSDKGAGKGRGWLGPQTIRPPPPPREGGP